MKNYGEKNKKSFYHDHSFVKNTIMMQYSFLFKNRVGVEV